MKVKLRQDSIKKGNRWEYITGIFHTVKTKSLFLRIQVLAQILTASAQIF